MAAIRQPDEAEEGPGGDGSLKKITLNIDLADYDRMRELLPEAKRLGAVPRSTTQTDVICEGLRLRLEQIEQAVRLKKRAKK